MTSADRDPAVDIEPSGIDETDETDETDTEGPRSSRPQTSEPRRPRLNVWAETALLIVIAVIIAIVVKSFFLQAFYIPSASMEPGLQGGPGTKTDDRVIVEKPSYWFGGTPQRGDVIVFADPGGWLGAEEAATPSNPAATVLSKIGLFPGGGHLVKRVIGVAGDTVSCCDTQGRILVNGVPLNEKEYARPASTRCGDHGAGDCYGPMPGTAHWTSGVVPKGFLFVMGDNRDNSADSSYHLCTAQETDCAKSPWVPVHDVVGKVVALGWPLGRAHVLHRPATFDQDFAVTRKKAGT